MDQTKEYETAFGTTASSGGYQTIPLSVKARTETGMGGVELHILLRDTRTGAEYTLTVPYTVRETVSDEPAAEEE